MKNFTKTILASAIMLIMFSSLGWGQSSIAGWDFSTQTGGTGNFGTSPLPVSTKDANITVGSLTRGSGFGTLTGSGAVAAWGSTNFTASGTLNGEISANKFFTFTVTANTNYKVSISGIAAYNIRRSSTGPTTGQWQYQVGSGSYVNIGSAITWGSVTTSSGNPQSAIDLSGISDLQNVSAGTTVTFRLVSYGASATTGTNYLKDLGNSTSNDLIINGTVTPVSSGTPTITTSSSMTSFGSIVINSTSTIQNYTVSGANLTSDIVITPPAGFEISTSNSPFAPTNPINLIPSGGTVANTNIYVRFAPTLVQTYSGNITHTSSGATEVNVSVSGTGIKGEPTNHAMSFAVNSSTASTIQLTWTDATGGTIPDGYILKGSSVDYSSISDPVDGVPESNSTLMQNITATTQACTFSGLNGNTVYYFKIFPYTNSGTGINYKIDGTVPSVSGSTADGSVSTDYFRSVGTGNWSNASVWESSHDNSTWISSTLAPDYNANTITILNGHTITLSASATIDQVVINNGGMLDNNTGTLTLNNGTGGDITIENGGTYRVTNTSTFATAFSFSTGSNILVKSGGKIQIGNGGTVGGSNNSYATSTSNVTWENGSIFDWNTTSIFGSSGATFFPNADASTIPIFRLSTTIGGNPGGGSSTVINGKFECNVALIWAGTGSKTFRNGITGSANMTQSTYGQWIISGSAAEIGGTGEIILGTNGLTINSGTSVVMSSSKTISGGNLALNGTLTIGDGNTLTVNGTMSGTGSITGSALSSLVIGGTGDMGTIYFTTGSEVLGNLTMDRTSSGSVTIGSNLNVNTVLTLTSGIINMSANTLTLGTSILSLGTLTIADIGSNASYITGNFERWMPAGVSGDVYFPVGTTNAYRPAIINYTNNKSSGGKLMVSGYDTDPGTINPSASLLDDTYTVDRYSKQAWWKFTTNTITGGMYDISLGAFAIDGVSQPNFGLLRLLKRADNTSNWSFSGTHSNATGTYNLPFVRRTGISNGFSEFGISGYSIDGNTLSNSPLPVHLSSFTSSANKRNITLNWSTSSEANNSGFDVERKGMNESNWMKAGYVQGSGNSNSTKNYSFTDRGLQTGKYQYRLKQIDFNGNYEYFDLNGYVEVGVPNKYDISQNYPNPFNPVTKIDYDLPFDSKVSLRIYDVTGREVKSLLSGDMKAGYYTQMFDASSLSSGIYFYRITANSLSGNFVMTKKMALIK